ncbi:MAG TPA: tryptophan synthase subunit alpha [Candidatus Thermoplasmatota archaeon]|nr:tryptophan synthase subunit alpha [Candidatus Thermoplasmatota archaeon]
MSRIAEAFAKARAEGRPALVAYVMAGEPDVKLDAELARAVLAEADVLEIGVPFSDPVADGPTIERAATRALARGVRMEHALALARELRAGSAKPILLMTYYNPVLQRGLDRFAREAREAGVDGVILPDVPLEESARPQAALRAAGLALVQLASPATPPDRFARLARATEGFLYVVSSFGVTGARDSLPPESVETVRRAAEACGAVVPFAVGFGVSRPEHVRQLHEAGAPGVVVGSAIVGRIEKGETPDALRAFVRALRGASIPGR